MTERKFPCTLLTSETFPTAQVSIEANKKTLKVAAGFINLHKIAIRNWGRVLAVRSWAVIIY